MAQGAVLGLDIGTRVIKFCELRPGREGPELLSWGVYPTPENTISNGVIVDPPTLAAAIRDLLASSGAKTRKVNCSVASQSSLVVRPIQVPRMTEAELAETMRWEVERYIPFAASEVVVDYRPLLPIDQLPPEAQNMDVLLAAGQEDMINAYVETLNLARLEPACLDVEPLSSARSLVDINADQGSYDQVIALVNIGAGTTDISIIRRGVLAFCRPVPLAGDSLTNAISENLGQEFGEAERLKTEEGLILFDPSLYRPALEGGETTAQRAEQPPARMEMAPAGPEEEGEGGRPVFDLGGAEEEAAPMAGSPAEPAPPPVPTPETVGDTTGKRVFESIAPTLAEMVTEIRRSLDFYSTRSAQTPVEKVLVFGGTARLPRFELFLSNELGIQVEMGDPLRRLQISDGMSEELRSFAPMLPIAVGMGIRDMLE
jgi:type IV pilus assembly protein PilM